jgi:hypothetical protein
LYDALHLLTLLQEIGRCRVFYKPFLWLSKYAMMDSRKPHYSLNIMFQKIASFSKVRKGNFFVGIELFSHLESSDSLQWREIRLVTLV